MKDTDYFTCYGLVKLCVKDRDLILQSFTNYVTSCYTCANCSKTIEVGQGNYTAEGEVYCKNCYCREVGLQGYGWSGGCGSLPPLVANSTYPDGNGQAKQDYHYTQFF